MATDANFVGRAGEAGRLVGIGGIGKSALAIEHANAVDAILVRDHAHGFVDSLAVVIEHGVPGRAGDATGELVRPKDHGGYQLGLLRSQIKQPANTTYGHNHYGKREDQLEIESAGHLGPSLRNGLDVVGAPVEHTKARVRA
jgi:hypothetical protein